MAKVKAVIQMELDPAMPVPELCAAVSAMLAYHKGNEQAVVDGLKQALSKFGGEIPEDKREWLKSVGMKEFEHPMKWADHNNTMFSEEYIRKTPLDEIKAGYERIREHCDGLSITVEDEENLKNIEDYLKNSRYEAVVQDGPNKL